MAFTGLPGTVLSTPGNVVPGLGASLVVTPPGPVVTLGVLMPDLQLSVSFGASKRILNGVGANTVADSITWSSVMPGGHHTLSCRIPDVERTANLSVYRYGATVTLRERNAVAEAGQIFWQGYLRTPIPNDDGTCDLVANGWHQLLTERDDALLWQDRYYGEWQPADAEGFALGINADSIDASVNNASLQFSVKKGSDLNDGQKARLVWYYANPTSSTPNTTVLPRRVAGTVYKNQSLGATPQFSLKLERFDSPTNKASAFTVDTMTNVLGNSNVDDAGTTFVNTIAQSVPHPVISFGLFRNGQTDSQGFSFKVTIRDLRVNDLATGDTYLSSQVIADLAAKMGFSVGSKVSTTTDNILPLFWQQGTWWDLVQYLSVPENVKWGVWEANPNPEFEFRPWGTGTTWTANAYGSSATVIAKLQPDDEVYNVVDVAYRKGSSVRIRHVRQAVSPDPFAGLTPQRVRTFRVELQDAQPDEALASSIATRLAMEFSTEQYAGTVVGSFFTTGGTDHTNYEARAGDLLTIPDFPGGSKTLRITGADHRDDGPSTLTIGRVPSSLDRLLWYADLKRRRKGLDA